MKSLLDKNEVHVQELFRDPEFLRDYGRVLRSVYLQYIPFLLKLLLFLGITLLQDTSFQIAKKKIQIIQDLLQKANQEKRDAENRKRETEKKEKLSRLGDITVANRILEKLDNFYLNERVIPSVLQVMSSLPDVEPTIFKEILSREKFQIIDRGSDDEDILLYPLNQEWRVRSARLRRVIDVILEESSDVDAILAEKAKRVQKLLSKKEKGSAEKTDDEDPYKKLAREMKKVEERQQMQDSSDSENQEESLDV
jgi:hypothetical protein